jgi:hypothetical protein
MFNWTGNKTSNNSSQHFKCRKKHKLSSLGLVQWLTKENIKNQNKQTIYTHHSLSWHWNTGLETCQWSGYCLTIHGIRPWILGAWLIACRSQTGDSLRFWLTGSVTVWQVLCKVHSNPHHPQQAHTARLLPIWGLGRRERPGPKHGNSPQTWRRPHQQHCHLPSPGGRPAASVTVLLRLAASGCVRRRLTLCSLEGAAIRDELWEDWRNASAQAREIYNGLLQQCRRHGIHRQAIRLRW